MSEQSIHTAIGATFAAARSRANVPTLPTGVFFGHTTGHAIEQASGYTLLHGEAVAIGMVLEARLAERIGVGACDMAGEIERVLLEIGLPVARPASIDAATVLAATRHDKKSRGGAVSYALPSCIGAMAGAERGWSIEVADSMVLEVLA